MRLSNSSILNAVDEYQDRREDVVETNRDIEKVSTEDINELSNLKSEISEDVENEKGRLERIKSASERALEASISALPDEIEVEDTPFFDAIESGAKSTDKAIGAAGLASIEKALSPLASDIVNEVEQQVFALTGIATFFLDYRQQFMLAVLKYLSDQIIKNLRILSNELVGIERIAEDMVRAVELSLEAKEQFSNAGTRRPDIFNNVADRIQNGINEIEFKIAYTEIANADDFKDASFLQNAINELDKAKELLPRTNTIFERGQRAMNSLGEASRILQDVAKRTARLPNKIRQIASSYSECLFLAYLIRNMSTNVTSGMKMASIVGAKELLEGRLEEMKERRDSNRAFAAQLSTENEINKKAVYERTKISTLQAKMQGINGLISGSTSDDYQDAYERIFEAVEDPFFFGEGDALVDIELYARLITGSSRLDDRRNKAVVAYGETVVERVRELQTIIDQLAAEIKFIEPVSNPASLVGEAFNTISGLNDMTRFIRQMSSAIGVKDPMMAIATGKIATKVAKDVLNSKDEQANTNSKTDEEAERITEGRKYASDTIDSFARAEMVANVRSKETESSIDEEDVSSTIAEAMKEYEDINIIKQLRMARQDI